MPAVPYILDSPVPESLPLPFVLFAAFWLGAVLGSFAACTGERLAEGRSLAGRSRCPSCQKALSAWQLAPVLGFFVQKGRCAFCQAPIPRASLVWECAMGAASALLVLKGVLLGAPLLHALLLILFFAALAAAAETDRRCLFLPDKLLLAALIPLLFLALAGGLPPENCLWGLAGAALLFAVRLAWKKRLKKEALGLGDIKLICIAGLAAGPGIFCAVLAASLAALAAAKCRPLKEALPADCGDGGRPLPFGPFLAAGAYLAVLLQGLF